MVPAKAPQSSDFRLFLQQELMRRCDRNPAYSLRAFARSLGLHHGTLSRVFAGKRSVNKKLVARLCESLRLSPAEADVFLNHLPKRKKRSPLVEVNEYKELSLDTFLAVSEWYHDAILEMTHMKSFRGDLKWIARTLGITISEVNIAVERLQRLELLSINKRGVWKDLSRSNTTIVANDFTSSALRKLQKKVLEMSIQALEEIPKELRDHTSMTVAIDSCDLPAAKEKFKKFRRELTAYFERKGTSPDAVYQLAFSLFPLTKPKLKG